MKILIANDDGIGSPGVYALAEAMRDDGHDVRVVAPQSERSGAGHSMTMFAPIEVFDAALPGLDDIPCYAISGTPVDCIKLGAGNLFDMPDLVITGINTGTNLGCDIYGSGTVNAAAAAIEKGIPALALSIGARHPRHLDVAASVAVNAVHRLLPALAAPDTLISINVPDKPREEIRGVKVTAIARPNPDYPYNEYISPRNRRWYWDSASPLNVYEPDEDVDARWYHEGYITVTPIRFDILDRKMLEIMQREQHGLLL